MAATGPDRADESVTHYNVLGITPDLLAAQRDPSALIKRAYHRALLRNHPDKLSQRQPPRGGGGGSSHHHQDHSDHAAAPQFSVDQIAAALAVLSSPAQRAAYDKRLRLSRRAEGSREGAARFQTGIVDVDLDDLDFDDAAEAWHRACRCGNDRAYQFGEDHLVEAADQGELIVGCQDCSLWLRVHFAVVEDGN